MNLAWGLTTQGQGAPEAQEGARWLAEISESPAGSLVRSSCAEAAMADVVFHMKTTLVIDEQVMTRLKEEAARQGTTISALVEAALRAFLRRPRRKLELPPLPSFRGGVPRVDIANREALEDAMGED